MVNKTDRIDFNSAYDTLCASGFNVNRRDQYVYVEAIPSNSKLNNYKKISKTYVGFHNYQNDLDCSFFCLGLLLYWKSLYSKSDD